MFNNFIYTTTLIRCAEGFTIMQTALCIKV